jgi:hypothetical protein
VRWQVEHDPTIEIDEPLIFVQLGAQRVNHDIDLDPIDAGPEHGPGVGQIAGAVQSDDLPRQRDRELHVWRWWLGGSYVFLCLAPSPQCLVQGRNVPVSNGFSKHVGETAPELLARSVQDRLV